MLQSYDETFSKTSQDYVKRHNPSVKHRNQRLSQFRKPALFSLLTMIGLSSHPFILTQSFELKYMRERLAFNLRYQKYLYKTEDSKNVS